MKNKIIVEINDKKYNVSLAITKEEKEKGLMGVENLTENEGMLFVYDEPQTVGMWMKNCIIPLDIIFINENEEVISIYNGQPNNTDIAEEDNVKYVLEINPNSDIKEGDEIEIEDIEEYLEESSEEIKESNDDTMKVLGPNAEIQMELVGGERIFSRKNTKIMLKFANKAFKSKKENDYKILGRKVFKFLDIQDSNTPEYVTK